MAASLISCGDPGPAPAPEPGPQPEPAPATSWPPGTCLAVDGIPIPTHEVDEIAAWIALIEPTDTLPARRRGALTHTVLERAALASAFADARDAARTRALDLREALAADDDVEISALLGERDERGVVEGTWNDLGLVAWGTARGGQLGTWLGPVEEAGRWLLLRPLEHVPGAAPGADLYRIDLLTLPFVPPDLTRLDVEEAIDDALLELVDPAWHAIVPAAWRLRMNGPD